MAGLGSIGSQMWDQKKKVATPTDYSNIGRATNTVGSTPVQTGGGTAMTAGIGRTPAGGTYLTPDTGAGAAPTSPALQGLQDASGLPPYEGTVPLGQAVNPETQYQSATQLALGAQSGMTQKELQASQAAAAKEQQQADLAARERQQAAQDAAEMARQQAAAQQTAALQKAQAEAAYRQAIDVQQGGAESELERMEKGAELTNEGWKQRFGDVTGFMSGGNMGDTGEVEYPDYNDPNSAYAKARAAAFARAKDTTGQISRSALNSLQNLYSGTNRAGSGALLARQGEAIGGGAGVLGDLEREQMIQDLTAAQEAATKGYEGRIEQRGQNIDLQKALLGLLNSGGAWY